MEVIWGINAGQVNRYLKKKRNCKLTGHVTRVIHFHAALKAEASYFNVPDQAQEGSGFTILPGMVHCTSSLLLLQPGHKGLPPPVFCSVDVASPWLFS